MPASDVSAWAKAPTKPTYTKAEVGLGNVDNTADSAKSVKYATSAGSAGAVAWANVSGKPDTFAPSAHNHNDLYYTEAEVDSKLSGKAAASHKHGAADITSVNASAINGVIAAANLPSFVDDVIEGYLNGGKFYKEKKADGTYSTEITAETGKIYVNLNDSKTYRWSGSAYVVISETIALGETSSTAYRGDRGATAYNHAAAKGSAFSNGLYKITTNAQGHVTAATAVQKSDITALGIPAQDTVYTHPTSSGNKHIPSGGSAGQFLKWSADGTAVWAADNNTTYSNFKGATSSAAGGSGLVPAPATGAANRYLRSDGTWQVPPDNNTWTALKGATTDAAGTAGYVAAPAKGQQGYFLRGDATWAAISKGTIGLGNVDNTADSNKSVKYATSAGAVPWSGVSGKPSAFTPSSHTHDDRYYTESEINSKLSGKANSSHTHTKSQITDFPTSMPASDVYSWAKQSSKPSYSASEVGAVPTSRKVNGKALSSDISLSAGDVGAAPSSHSHNYAGSSSAGGSANWANGANYANYAFSNNGVSTSGSGSAYTATVSGFSLATGKSIVMIPHVTSTTTTPTLNVSNTGAKNIRMRLSSSTSSTIPLINSSFLTQNKPVKVTYDGTYWVIDDFIQPDANNLYGKLISRGSSAPSNGTAGFIYIQTT